jgi:hypothetical protein
MPPTPPPARLRGMPNRVLLPAGTRLWRVHQRRYPSDAFNPQGANEHFGGGSFDSTRSDPYPFLYAAFTGTTAVAEVLLRGLPFDDRGARILPRKMLAGRRLSVVELTGDVTLVALLSALDLAAVGQDEWLVQAEAAAYGQTRHWAHWLRHQATWAQGFIWPSKRNLPEHAVVLFGDRCPPGLLQATPDPLPEDLDTLKGALLLRRLLAPYGVTVRLPQTSVLAGSAPPP